MNKPKTLRRSLTLVMTVLSLSAAAQFTTEKAHAIVEAYYASGKASGVALVAQKGRILFEEGYGYKDVAGKKPNDVHTIFQIGSVTKQFTSAVILQLQAEKKLSVTDKLSKYFPGLPHADSITLHQLLTHTSGLYNYTRNEHFMKEQATLPHSQAEMLALFKDKPLGFVPGTQWEYSNSNYLLLGYIIEKVTGKSYPRVVRERILTPLKMTSSGFDFTHFTSPDKAIGYNRLGNDPQPAPIVDSTASYSAGALYSTVEDLYKWDRALYTNTVLTPEMRQVAFTAVKNHYGYGWAIDSLYGRVTVSHGGGIFGFTSQILRFPADETVVILLDNSGSGNLTEMSRAFAAVVFGQPYQLPQPIAEITVPDSTLQSYVGKYEIRPGFIMTMTVEGGHFISQATNQPKFELHAQSPTLFFVTEFEAKVEFVRDAGGKVSQIILHQGGRNIPAKRIE